MARILSYRKLDQVDRIVAASAGAPPQGALGRIVAFLLAAPFPPTADDPRILLSDWSFWQGVINILKYLGYGPPRFQGTIIRTGQGHYASYDDAKFLQNVKMCEAHNHPWMIYHVLMPNQDVARQVGNLVAILERTNGPMPRFIWWDVEVKNEQSKRTISTKTIQAINLTKPEIGIDAGIYSAKWFTDGYMETQDWFADAVWWVAQWLNAAQGLEHPWPNALPATVRIDQVMLHQTTSWGDGPLVGIESKRLDLDRWMWTPAMFEEIMGTGNGNGNGNGDVPPGLAEQVRGNSIQIALINKLLETQSGAIGDLDARLAGLTGWAQNDIPYGGN